ncbi:MAG: hypothetical protein QF732_05020 [Nitrospinaceae bacterium]|jgi:hypothetical protein|nr:hypothetical protein [Nitrospinaceae bacterium]
MPGFDNTTDWQYHANHAAESIRPPVRPKVTGISPPDHCPPFGAGIFPFWGGGTPDKRTFCAYVGILGEGYFESSPWHQWAMFVDDPDDTEWGFLDGHDLWILVCGFCPRGRIRDLVAAADNYAKRIIVYDKLKGERLPLARYV